MDPIFLNRSDMLKPPLRPKDQMRGDINQQIAEFFSRGGKVQELPSGQITDRDYSFSIAKPQREDGE